MYRLILAVMLSIVLFVQAEASNEKKKIEVGIEENLGAYLPLDAKLTGEDGKPVVLKDIINKPTILLFVYFECTGLCSPLLSEVAAQVDNLDLVPGVDYNIVCVSFDPEDNAELAAAKKFNYLGTTKKKIDPAAWRFLTGDSATVKKLTDAAGFFYKKEGDEFIHAGTLIMVSPQGKITRYLLGTSFLPFDIKMALYEANEGKISPTIALSKVMKFCFKYDAENKTYVLNITRMIGIFMLIVIGAFVAFLLYKPKKKEIVQN